MAGYASQLVNLFLLVFFAGVWLSLIWLSLPALARKLMALRQNFHWRAPLIRVPMRQPAHAQHTLP